MNTPTHLLVAAALLARPGRKQVNRGALVGALLPDLSLYVLVAAAAAQGFSFKTIFDELYFSQSWQSVFAIDNSAPLYAALLCAGLLLRFPFLWALAIGALLHVALEKEILKSRRYTTRDPPRHITREAPKRPTAHARTLL